MDLAEHIGTEIIALIPSLHAVKLQKLKLHAVENGGIWIESQSITNQVLQMAGVASSPKTLVLFLPYSSITYICSSLDTPGLDEKAFGL